MYALHPTPADFAWTLAHPGAAGRLLAGWRRRADLALRLLLVVGLLLVGVAPKAWDAERMLAAAKARGPQAVSGVKALQMALSLAAELNDDGKLLAVNRFYNQRIQFREDTEVWGQVDYWASPLETLERGQGDCEDFAIAKYFSLLAVGVPVPRLRLVYVRAQLDGTVQAHMVLAYYATPTAEPVILDNLVPDVLPASRRSDLSPVFSFNGEGLWQGVGYQSAGDPTSRLSRWREVMGKARTEGFQ